MLIAVLMMTVSVAPSTARAATVGRAHTPAIEFHPVAGLTDYMRSGFDLTGAGQFVARLKIPAGARATHVTLYYRDNHPSADVCILFVGEARAVDGRSAHLIDFPLPPGACSTGASVDVRAATVPLFSNTINVNEALFVGVLLPVSTIDLQIRGASVRYTMP